MLTVHILEEIRQRLLEYQRENCPQFLVPIQKFFAFRKELKLKYPRLQYTRQPRPARAVWEVWDGGYLLCRIYVLQIDTESDIFSMPSRREQQEVLFSDFQFFKTR